jgi:hypothetical protein
MMIIETPNNRDAVKARKNLSSFSGMISKVRIMLELNNKMEEIKLNREDNQKIPAFSRAIRNKVIIIVKE